MRLYKAVFARGGLAWGIGRWSIPKNGRPGEWVRATCCRCLVAKKPCRHQLVPCHVGLHLATKKHIGFWVRRMKWHRPNLRIRVFEVELPSGARVLRGLSKVIVRRARLAHEVDPETLRRLP